MNNPVCPKCGSSTVAERSWTCGSWYQDGFFRSVDCRDIEIANLKQQLEEARAELILNAAAIGIRDRQLAAVTKERDELLKRFPNSDCNSHP